MKGEVIGVDRLVGEITIEIPGHSSTISGYLDKGGSGYLGGWAKDSSSADTPIDVDIYVDGMWCTRLTADKYRPDVGDHAFHWNYGSFGYTQFDADHEIRAIALGVGTDGRQDLEISELTGSPQTVPGEKIIYVLSQGDVAVHFDASFGGAIRGIYDYKHFGNRNLINDTDAGAMFQVDFSLYPAPEFKCPPNCKSDAEGFRPNQAGYYGDGLAGNPIGIYGTNPAVRDEKEFLYYDGTTLHFKTRLIDYHYCFAAEARSENACLWDRYFFLEQWARFDPYYPDTLVLESRISYEPPDENYGPRVMWARELPIIFGCDLRSVAFQRNGDLAVEPEFPGEAEYIVHENDDNWAALVCGIGDGYAGIGMVVKPTMRHQLSPDEFTYKCEPLQAEHHCGKGETRSWLFPSGAPDLSTMGSLSGVAFDDTSDARWIFQPGGSFTWTTYFPIGDLDELIWPTAEAILADWPEYMVVVESSDCPLEILNRAPVIEPSEPNSQYRLLGRWHVGRSECNEYPNGSGHTGGMTTADYRPHLAISSGWMALYGEGDDLLVIAEHDDITGVAYPTPSGYVKISSWHVGGVTDGQVRLVDAYGRTMSSGWVALCVRENRVGDFGVFIERDDCADRGFQLPDTARWYGSWHVGTGVCDGYPRGISEGKAISSGWLTFVEWEDH